MRFEFVALFTLIFSVSAKAQVNVDSLRATLADKDISDSLRVESYRSLSWYYLRKSVDSSLYYSNEGLKLSIRMGFHEGTATLYNQRGLALRSRGEYDKALPCFLHAAEINLRLGESQDLDLAGNYGNIGGIYQNKGELAKNKVFSEKAIEYYSMAREIFAKHDDKMGLAGCHVEMGIIHYDYFDYEKSIEEYNEALAICEELGFTPGIAMIKNNLANIYNELGDSVKSLELNFEVLKFHETNGDSSGLTTVLANIAGIYNKMTLWNKAIDFGERSYAIAVRLGSKEDIKNSAKMLSTSYSNLGNHSKGFEYLMTSVKYKDSLLTEATSAQMEEQEGKFQNEKKTLEIENLTQRSKLRDIESRQKEETYALQEKITWSVVGGGVLSLILLIVAVRGYLQKRKANLLIAQQKLDVEMQKEIVEAKNEEILDSINYAKRIQTAILPPIKQLKQLLPQSFVFYKPKDIVAGDFYWLEKKGEYTLLAAADCTGHGVPGALVSVICHNGLNRSVREHNLVSPSEILDKTREIIISEFEKSDDEVKDGMDISLMALGRNELRWAGANNPLWMIRSENGVPQLIEVKPDKQPIGKYAEAKPFTEHRMEVRSGDLIYIFTDGYQDQFGGEKGKKFKAKTFKDYLLSISASPMDEQLNLVRNAFEKWRGDLEQVDDICVIGLRI